MWWWRLWWRRRRGWWWWWPCLVIYDPPAGNEPNLLNQAIMVGEYFYMISWYDNMISYTFVGLQDTSIWQGILQYLGLFRFHIIFIWSLVCNRQGFIVGNFGVNTNYLKSNCKISRCIRLKSIACICTMILWIVKILKIHIKVVNKTYFALSSREEGNLIQSALMRS